MPKIILNGNDVEFEQGMTVLQACELGGEEIPRFCYHERLKIAGNCRMCLVQIEGGPPKPAASCAMPAGDGMVVHTNTEMVKKAREGVMEFQLINHPLDCPVCDQGGECDLQDFSYIYGAGKTRYKEPRHVVKEKNYGPLIKTNMTRCIHCTRCVRFMEDVAGVPDIGGIGRGESMEISTFIQKNIGSEVSGNIIDLCPVGALTSKPYAFKARSWELDHTESIDIMDAVGSNIRVDSRGGEVMRILPRLNEGVNEEWISDKARFSYDGLGLQRLDRPYIRKNGKLVESSWEDAVSVVVDKLQKTDMQEIGFIAGDLADSESMYLLKNIAQNLSVGNIDCRTDNSKLTTNDNYLFNSTIAGIDDADVCLIIGANPRYEASIVNTRLLKRSLEGGFEVAIIGGDIDLTYKINNLGDSTDIIKEIASGEHEFSKVLKNAKNPMVIVGDAILTRNDGAAILVLLQDMCKKFNIVRDDWNGFNILHSAASRVAGLEMDFLPQEGGSNVAEMLGASKLLYLLNADEIDFSLIDDDVFVIYQGHHGEAGANRADVILPGSAYTEKNATYINMEGRAQYVRKAVSAPNLAKEDWQIVNLIAQKLGFENFMNILEVRKSLIDNYSNFAINDTVIRRNWKERSVKGRILKSPVAINVNNFYMSNVICRASETMAKCAVSFGDK